ncbi:hypothetical protein AMIS_60700 [Actinoplanes missouriensis 431]|uniref:Uncharacterized protein n=1 Tax=Actinoplanes missouriensis (strain ATCC 14538 / DSM 43046 / CBS 188.64 / JCM 3121 / NBRC 102363 / NCIMB 12654 / NRRL B-3342 / UNCC 431) TaxID=512565 RepID=I0HE53_ACTM4|nr:hypothetical protein [Actinoplanes missouriensis]BAL91290.1 hypothetical protein AMIS_60700 [Actinoplanes missouriensis 431]
MSTEQEDHLHERFLLAVAPLMVDPIGGRPAGPALAGIVRAGADETRVMLRGGVAVSFRLTTGESELDIHAAFDWIRDLTPADLVGAGGERDSHGYATVPAEEIGFSADRRATRPDTDYFTLLRMMLYGSSVWSRELYSLVGFLIRGPRRHRLYVRDPASGVTVGLDLPLTDADGEICPGMGGTFPMLLASVFENGELDLEREAGEADEYCSKVYDMSGWVLPPPAGDTDPVDDAVPDDFENLMILSPEQYRELLNDNP